MEMASGRAKRSEIWGLGVQVENIWDTFGLVIFKITLRSFDALELFENTNFTILLLLH